MTRPRIEDTPIFQPSGGEDTFTGFSHVLSTSAAFGVLTPVEWKVYTQLMIRHNGYNNGEIVLGVAKTVEETGICRQKVMPAFRRLEELGLIVRRYMGKLLKDKDGRISGASEKRASEWEITDYHTWDAPIGTEGRRKVPPARTFADWSPEKQAIVPGSRSPDLPKPRAGATKVPAKARAITKTRATAKTRTTVKRPASLRSASPAPSAPSRSQRSEPTIPEPTSPAPDRQPEKRTYGLDDILRDDARWLDRHGSPRPPTQSRPDGRWWYLGKRISLEQAEALTAADVPF